MRKHERPHSRRDHRLLRRSSYFFCIPIRYSSWGIGIFEDLNCRRWRPRARAGLAAEKVSHGKRDHCQPRQSWYCADRYLCPCACRLSAVMPIWQLAHAIDLTVVGPEAPLVAGIVDQFQNAQAENCRPDPGGGALGRLEDLRKAVFQQRRHPYGQSGAMYKLRRSTYGS